MMRWRYWMFAAMAICGLILSGCGGADNKPKPPSGATTDTPVLDIDEGLVVPADAVSPKMNSATNTGSGAAKGAGAAAAETGK